MHGAMVDGWVAFQEDQGETKIGLQKDHAICDVVLGG